MPKFLLRNSSVVAAYPNEFCVLMEMDDGYELRVGGIAEGTGAGMRVFWTWSCPGSSGESDTRESAMEAFRAAWRSTDEDLAEMRQQQESTANKYALWDAGYKGQVAAGEVRCPCGVTFSPRHHDQTMAHIEHITGRQPGT